MAHWLKKILFRISPDDVSFARRGFKAADTCVQAKLEAIGHAFVEGYTMALEAPEKAQLASALVRRFDAHHVGFAFEGAGFFYALLDVVLPPRQSHLRVFTSGPGRAHDYIATVGAGFALARVPWGRRYLARYLAGLDPMLAWCVPDRYGFHQGFFHHQRYVVQVAAAPSTWSEHARRLFDAGVGRSLW